MEGQGPASQNMSATLSFNLACFERRYAELRLADLQSWSSVVRYPGVVSPFRLVECGN
jgi:hypothetical protein